MVVDDHIEVTPGFSIFNKHTEHPFETVPNVFII